MEDLLFSDTNSNASEVAPALKYRNVNIVTPSPGEVKGLINNSI